MPSSWTITICLLSNLLISAAFPITCICNQPNDSSVSPAAVKYQSYLITCPTCHLGKVIEKDGSGHNIFALYIFVCVCVSIKEAILSPLNIMSARLGSNIVQALLMQFVCSIFTTSQCTGNLHHRYLFYPLKCVIYKLYIQWFILKYVSYYSPQYLKMVYLNSFKVSIFDNTFIKELS